MEGKITFIVPVYNIEKYINKCIQSIISQTYKNIEVMDLRMVQGVYVINGLIRKKE